MRLIGEVEGRGAKVEGSDGLRRMGAVFLAVGMAVGVWGEERPRPTEEEVAYGPKARQVLDFWRAEASRPTPVVLYFHGGSWIRGDKKDVPHVARYLAAGVSVVAVNYRFVPQAEAAGVRPPVQWPMHDAARAVQFVRHRAAAWGLDATRVAASGDSAGGCTSLWLALHDDLADPASSDPVARESTRLRCAGVTGAQTTLDPRQMREWMPASFYGGHAFGFLQKNVTGPDTGDFAAFLAQREEILPWIRAYSPYELASADDPPVFLAYRAPPAEGPRDPDPTHSSIFGLKLQARLRAVGGSADVAFPTADGVAVRQVSDFIIEQLTK